MRCSVLKPMTTHKIPSLSHVLFSAHCLVLRSPSKARAVSTPHISLLWKLGSNGITFSSAAHCFMPYLPWCSSPQAICLLGLVMHTLPTCAHHWTCPSYRYKKRAEPSAAGLFKYELSCPQNPLSTVDLFLVVDGDRCLPHTIEPTEVLLR